jgi:hypothetical protein
LYQKHFASTDYARQKNVSSRYRSEAGRIAIWTTVILGLAGLADAINSFANHVEPLVCRFQISFFSSLCPQDIKTVLVGKYQVVLGPGGGCNGGPPNSRPTQPAFIDDDRGAFTATNECGNKSAMDVIDNRHGTWWGQTIDFKVNGRDVVITERKAVVTHGRRSINSSHC